MVFETLIAKAAGLSLLAKGGVAAAAFAVGATGAGLTGMLPEAAQDAELPDVEVVTAAPEVELPDVELPAQATERPDPEPSERP